MTDGKERLDTSKNNGGCMKIKEEAHSEIRDEIALAEISYRTVHKLIKSGMWKMYCNRNFRIVRVEWSDAFRALLGFKDEREFPNREQFSFQYES